MHFLIVYHAFILRIVLDRYDRLGGKFFHYSARQIKPGRFEFEPDADISQHRVSDVELALPGRQRCNDFAGSIHGRNRVNLYRLVAIHGKVNPHTQAKQVGFHPVLALKGILPVVVAGNDA